MSNETRTRQQINAETAQLLDSEHERRNTEQALRVQENVKTMINDGAEDLMTGAEFCERTSGGC